MHLNTRIDRFSYIPLYAQVREALREAVDQGTARADEQLPSEPELCRLFDVSRTVVRQALVGLEHEGLVVRIKGKGTFVAKPKIGENLFQEPTGFYQDMAQKRQTIVSQVLKQHLIPAGTKLADHLGLAVGAQVIHVDRLRFVNDEPLVYVSTYLPYALCPALLQTDLTHQSLYAFLEREYDLVIARGHRTIRAVVAGEYEARLLSVSEGAPLIALDSIGYLDDGTPLEYYTALHRGDRSMFEVDLVRSRNGAAAGIPLALVREQSAPAPP